MSMYVSYIIYFVNILFMYIVINTVYFVTNLNLMQDSI
jgi:hypothetical protein